MTAVRWKRVERWTSWHLLRGDNVTTVCGRQTPASPDALELADELPGNEKTCERCAVLASKAAPAPTDSPGPFEGVPV